jgi:hypothetical protein
MLIEYIFGIVLTLEIIFLKYEFLNELFLNSIKNVSLVESVIIFSSEVLFK